MIYQRNVKYKYVTSYKEIPLEVEIVLKGLLVSFETVMM